MSGLFNASYIYGLYQVLFAPGFKKITARQIGEVLKDLPPAESILDVGCGPSSYLWWFGLHPVGLDMSRDYTKAFGEHKDPAIAGSSDNLPFRTGHFDGVWSFGLLHHLPEDKARRSITEMMRVCKPGGYIVIFDAVLPEPLWSNPLAWIIRRLDRGRHMRRQESIEMLLPDRGNWSCKRVVYSLNGLEGVYCVYKRRI